MAESLDDTALSGSEAFWRIDLSNALLLIAAIMLGLYGVVRPVAFQWSPCSTESALAGILACVFVLAAWGASAVYPRRASRLPDGVVAVLILWLGLHVAGVLRSPHMGAGLPLASEAGLNAALLMGGFAAARAWPGFVSAAARLLVAAGCLEAILGFWQKFLDLPMLRKMAEQKALALPDILFTQQGQDRLYSEEIFGTFGNANSYAGFLLVTSFLLLGLWLDAWRRNKSAHGVWHAGYALCLAIQLAGLYISGSKGGWVAAMAGVWFFAIQVAPTTSTLKRILGGLTGLGLTATVAILFLAAAGPLRWLPFPASLAIRFEYWLTGWGMVEEQPWLGVGLGGFGEAYPQHKGVLGTETILAHNDYLQLWAEMGILAPIVYLVLWFLILRPRQAETATEEKAAEDTKDALTTEQVRTRVLAMLMLVGGLIGALFMVLCFGRMHGNQLHRFFTGEATEGARAGAMAAAITPFCFAGALMLLLLPLKTAVSPPGKHLWVGVRAAVGAVLVHQLVDFDMTAQAIMAWLFLLGGFLLAQAPADPRPGPLARVARYAPPVLIAVLFYPAVLSPLFSGQARESAHADEETLRETGGLMHAMKLEKDDRADLMKKIAAVQAAMAISREKSFRWAPYDGTAALERALAYLQLQRSGVHVWQPYGQLSEVPLEDLITESLNDTIRLRPRWHGAQLVTGHIQLEWGVNALGKGLKGKAQARFQRAEQAYRKAQQLYPLSPSHLIVIGDALLLQGKAEAAAEAYRDAWEVDRRILDPNVRFGSIFHDPLPGCLIKHGRESDVQQRLTKLLRDPSHGTEFRRGLLVRQFLVAAWRLLGSRPPGGQSEFERFTARVALINACEGLFEMAPNDGHAALFRALAMKGFHKPETTPGQQLVRAQWECAPLAVAAPGEQTWAAAAAFALLRERTRARDPWRKAVELQAQSVARGQPDTLPEVFEQLRIRAGLPKDPK